MQAQPTTASWSKAAKARQSGIYWRRKNGRVEYGYLRPLGNVEFAGTTLQSAIDARSKALLRKSSGQPAPNTKLRMRDLIAEVREASRERLKPSSFDALERSLAVIGDEFGNLRPAQVSAHRIERLVRDLEGRGLASASIRRYLSPLREILNRAIQHDAVATNAWDALTPAQRPKTTERRRRFEWTPEARNALLDAARALDERPAARQRYYALICTLAATGVRVGEALGLRWHDVDLLGSVIRVEHSWSRKGELGSPKTDAGRREVPIPDELLRILVDHKAEDADDTDFVFAARHGERPMSYWNFRHRGFAEALKVAGLKGQGITVHDLRHGLGSFLLAQGVPLVDVADQLGHSDPSLTARVYSHVDDRAMSMERRREAAGRIGVGT